MTKQINDKRHFHRIFYNSDVTLKDGANFLTGKLVDISLKGSLVRFDKPWNESLEKIYILELRLSGTISITMQVSVSHVVGYDVGFKCEHIDLDSISQLRRLVELNLGDNDMLERDLLALSEWKQEE